MEVIDYSNELSEELLYESIEEYGLEEYPIKEAKEILVGLTL